ncbi:MAG: PAS domain-containing protein [Candidatus Eisenbacteria bacterium]|nr:PAS domain-containing protein [Candidatus Eisenbacteria bacterium]
MPTRSLSFLELFSEGPTVIFVWDGSPGWPVQFASPNVHSLLGLTATDLTAGRMDYSSLIHPDDVDEVRAEVERAVQDGDMSFTHRDYRLLRPDGTVRWVSDHTRIKFGPSGDVSQFYGYIVDVTDRRMAEKAASEGQQRLELVIEGGRIGTWDWYPQTNAVVFNEYWAELLGYRLDEIEQSIEAWSTRVHPDDMAKCQADLQAHVEGRTQFYQNVHRMRHRDGHWVYILDRGKVVERDAEGNVYRFSGTHTDITEQKRAEIEAQEASRSKGRFLARMSHEIRTPLNGVIGVTQLLERTPLNPEQDEYVRTIRSSGEGLLKIINDILDFSRIEAGQIEFESSPFSPVRELESIVALFQERAYGKGLRLALQVGEGVPSHVSGDAHRIRQVILNLVSNAIKFTDNGEVAVRVSAEPLPDFLVLPASPSADETQGSEVARSGRSLSGTFQRVSGRQGKTVILRIEVSDTGKGIDNFDAIWRDFGQEDASISRRYGGTGLGLPISRQLVELMNGRLEVESEISVGSRFVVSIPLPSVEALEETRERRSGPSLKGLRILVAEDNPVNQLVIGRMLQRLGIEVHIAEDGLEAVSLCESDSFDFVLMDIHMPGIDGIEATRRILAGTDSPPVVIGVSADVMEENRARCEEAGIVEMVSKPLRFDELTGKLQHHLPTVRARRAA